MSTDSKPRPLHRYIIVRRSFPVLALGIFLPLSVIVLVSILGSRWVADQSQEVLETHWLDQSSRSLEVQVRYEVMRIEHIIRRIEEDVTAGAQDVLEALAEGRSSTPPIRPGSPDALPPFGFIDPVSGAYGNFDQQGPCSPWLSAPALSQGLGDPVLLRQMGRELHALCSLSRSMRARVDRRADLIRLYWVMMASGIDVVQPPYDLLKMLEENPELPQIDEWTQPYLKIARPEENPDRATRWTPPYLDPFSGAWMMSCVAPIYSTGEDGSSGLFAGATGMDVLLSTIMDQVLHVSVPNGGHAMLLQSDGKVLVAPEAAIRQFIEGEDSKRALRMLLRPPSDQQWDEVLLKGLEDARITNLQDPAGESGRLNKEVYHFTTGIGGVSSIVTVAPVPHVNWLLVTVVPVAITMEPVQDTLSALSRLSNGVTLASVLAALLAVIAGCIALWSLHRQIVQPIVSLAEAVRGISWERPVIPPMEVQDDEISELYMSFTAAVRAARIAGMEAEQRMEELSINNTRLAELNAELEEARWATEQASRRRSEFLVNMSHEIRTPMNAILSMTQILLGGDLPSAQRNQSSILSRAANRLLKMLDDILEISRLESGKITLEHQPFSLRDTLQDIKIIFTPTAAAKGLTLSCEIGSDVPDIVMGDGHRLNQIVNNLLSNAIKFTARGGIGIRLALLNQTEGAVTLELTVRDTGIGIGPEGINKVFDPFTQEDSSVSRRFGGTGLGLAICKELCEMMGGSISVSSERGQGSVFRCVLTFGVSAVDVAHQPQAPEAGLAPDDERLQQMAKRGAQVLLVDDNEINLQVGEMLLESLHVRVLTAENGTAALDILRGDAQVDLVLMDVQMPVMDGLTATAAIRRLPAPARAHLPVIALTAQAMSRERQQSLDAGMNGHLVKPIDSKILLETLAKWLLAPAADGKDGAPAPPVAREMELPLMDVAQGLSLLKTPANYARILALFMQTHDREKTFAPLLRKGALSDCSALAHQIRGSASSVALRRLAFSAERIEQAIEAGRPVDALIPQFEAIMADTHRVVQAYIHAVQLESRPARTLPARGEGLPRRGDSGPLSTTSTQANLALPRRGDSGPVKTLKTQQGEGLPRRGDSGPPKTV